MIGITMHFDYCHQYRQVSSGNFIKRNFMKKILLVFDGVNFSQGAFEFTRRLNEKEKVLVTALFIPQMNYANVWSYEGTPGLAAVVPTTESGIVEEERVIVEQNMERFEHLCKANDIEYRMHKDSLDFSLPELRKETRFADVVILGSESFYASLGMDEPNEYLKWALHGLECPVIIVPEKFEFPDKNILAYDGTESSVYAIKQFAYLFPEFTKLPTLLVYSKEETEGDIPDLDNIAELAARHFSDLEIMKLNFDPYEYFAAWISETKKPMLVTGSFGRSFLSRVFKKSFITEIIADNKLPIFISH